MILWHPDLLPELPVKLLTALHRDVCRIRSSQWKSPKNAKTWFYALPWGALVWYHGKVIREMQRRGWKPSPAWFDPLYRGKCLPSASPLTDVDLSRKQWNTIFCKTCPFSQDKLEKALNAWKAKKNVV